MVLHMKQPLFLHTDYMQRLLLLLLPALIGALFAWANGSLFHWLFFLFALLIPAILTLITDYSTATFLNHATPVASIGGYLFYLACSLLTFLVAYTLQSQHLSTQVFLAGFPISIAIATVLTFDIYNTINMFTAQLMRIYGVILLLIITLTLALNTVLQIYPWYSIVTVLIPIPALNALRLISNEKSHIFPLLTRMKQATIQIALVITVSLIIHRIISI